MSAQFMADNTKQTDFRYSEQFEADVFWELHGRKIMTGVAVLIIVGIGLYFWQHQAQQAADAAAQRLAAAQDVPALEAVIRDYAGKEMSAQAMLRLADVHYREGRYADAAGQYQKFLEQFPKNAFAPSARLGLAAVEEAQGRLDVAGKLYVEIVAADPEGYTVVLAKLGAARCAEAQGRVKDARQLYEEAAALAQGTALQGEAQLRIMVLGRVLPLPASATTNDRAPQPTP